MAENYLEEKKILPIHVQGIGEVGIESLAETLKHKRMTCLDITAGKQMDYSSLKAVADVLKDTQITSLVFNNNEIGCNGLKYLSGVLKDTRITHLNLRNNNIQNEGFIYLAEILNSTQIRNLNLETNQIDFECDVLRLTEALRHTQITHLNLSDNKITCNGLKHLATILKGSQINDLDLSYNNFRDNGVKYLAEVLEDTQISQLNLRYNKIGFEAAEYLNRQLKYITFESILIGVCDADNGEQLISQCGAYISIYSYNIGRAGSRYISECFCEKNISTLNFSLAFHGCTENDICYLSQAFSNIKIQSLTVLPEYFTRSCHVDYLVKIFEKSQIGRLSMSRKVRATDIHYLADFLERVKIFELDISYNYLTDESIKSLAPGLKNSAIIDLDLSGNNITSEGAKYLSEILQNSKIVFINLCNCSIGVEGAKHLANGLPHSQVTGIHLHGNGIEYAGYQALIDVVDDTNISWVNLHRNNIEEGMNGEKLWPYSIPRNTTTIAYKIEKAFRNLVSLSSDGKEFEFIVPDKQTDSYPPVDIHQYAFLIGTLKTNPNSKVHTIYEIFKKGMWNYDFEAMKKMDYFIENITNKFILFFENKLPDLLARFSDDDYVYLVKQFEEFKLYNIVQSLLFHRILYYVDENQEILHPYIYKLLKQYNLPLYNSELEPNKKTKIISYYESHEEIDGSQEIIDMLKSIVL